jgi:XTP/dITP diphosphohydrolase
MTLPLPLALATQNDDKAREIVEVFVALTSAPLGAYRIEDAGFVLDDPLQLATVVDALPLLTSPPDVEETGATLEDNARIKAAAIAGALQILAVADDTGLEVDALDGAPGVYSARYAGPSATYADNVTKLLRELDGFPLAQRTARFATVALARWPDGREVVARGEVEGEIALVAAGKSGFGYDPVFRPAEGDGRTFAEMTPAEKHAVSHRGRAFRSLAQMLTETR